MLNQSKHLLLGLWAPPNVMSFRWEAKVGYPNNVIDFSFFQVRLIGGAGDERYALDRWSRNVGLPALQRLVAAERLGGQEVRQVSYRDSQARFRIVASPKRSFGYLYICATPYDPS